MSLGDEFPDSAGSIPFSRKILLMVLRLGDFFPRSWPAGYAQIASVGA
jgi:hypothetical protein